jgi:hypothetical protein
MSFTRSAGTGQALIASNYLPSLPGYTYVPVKTLPSSFTLTQTSTSNAWTHGAGQVTDGGANPILTLVADAPSDLYSARNPGIWYRLRRQDRANEYVRHGGFVMFLGSYVANNYDYAWAFFLKNGTTNQVKIWNPYPANGVGYWVQSGIHTAGRIAISTTDPLQAHIYTISVPPSPPISLTGTPLFTQLSPSATSSAVGAFSLRAVNGTSARAVAVQAHPVGTWPPIAMTSNTTTATGTFNGVTNGVYTASQSPNAYEGQNNSYFAFDPNPTDTYWHSALTYNADGSYNGTTTQTDGYTGEWLQIQFPTPIILYSYSMINRLNLPSRSPKNFRIYGSNNGADWTNIDTRTNVTQWSFPTRLTFTLGTNTNVPYSYFRLVVNATIGPNSVQVSSWVLNGPAAAYTTGSPQDFYADRLGNLLTAPVTGQTLANWLGGATGYVTTWYNQIQPGQDVSATVAANQPTIDPVNKTIIFNGTNQSFSNTATTGGLLAACVGTGTKYTYVASWNKANPSSTGRICEHNSLSFTNNQASALIAFNSTYGFNGESNDNHNLVPLTLGTQVSTVMRLNNTSATNLRVRSNGTDYSGSTGNYATLSLNNFWFVIGRKASNNSEFFNGSMKSVMVFKDALSDADTTVLDTWQQTL